MKNQGWLVIIFLGISISGFGQENMDIEAILSEAQATSCKDVAIVDSLLGIAEVMESASPNAFYRGNILGIRGNISYCRSEFSNAIRYSRAGVEVFTQNGYLYEAGKLLGLLSSCYRAKHQIDSAAYFVRQSAEIGKAIGSEMLRARSNFLLASVFIETHEHDSVLYYSLEALKIAEVYPDSINFTAGILHNMGIAYSMAGNYQKANEIYLEAEARYEKDQYKAGLPCLIHVVLGQSYIELGEYQSAIESFGRGIVYAEGIQSDFMMAYLKRELGHAYYLLKDYSRSIAFCKEALVLSNAIGLSGNVAVVYEYLLKCYTATGDYQQAIRYGELGLQNTEDTHNLGIRKSILEEITIAYEKVGYLRKAIKALREEKELDIALREKEKDHEFLRLQAVYETEKKETEIASLSQQATIQGFEIRQKNQLLILIGVVVLFVASAVFFIVNHRTGKRKRAQTELEHRFLRSQLNPHFIFNSLVSVQTFLFKKETDLAAMYLTKFSKLIREILENSRQEFIPLGQELSMLTNYLDLHRLRLEKKFEFDIHIGENVDSAKDMIPPMFVQPFVENAIEHGVVELPTGGKIELNFQKMGEFIQIEVLDNGIGIENTTLGASSHNSLSTTIIKERMDLFNQSLRNKIQLVIEDRTNLQGNRQGTRIELMVPFEVS